MWRQIDKSRVGGEVRRGHTRAGSQADVGHGDDGGDARDQLGALQFRTLERGKVDSNDVVHRVAQIHNYMDALWSRAEKDTAKITIKSVTAP